jgi:serine/threonine protein kinase/tetratricopeptide (TPR) repeat protein
MLGKILGHYRIVEKIGAGGMGEVYRAHDQHLDRDVAIKILPPAILADEVQRKQFRREALLLAKLNHPYIETVHEFGHEDGVDFLVMELIPGKSLGAILKEGPLAEKVVLRLGVQFLEGLCAAHQQGVIHRDLKPANLFVTPEGRIKILDFGLAKLVHPENAADVTRSISTDTGTISGTVPYMAPEQLRGEAADVRSDVYSAGAVLYEIATGRRPFPQTQGPQLIGAILHEPPAAPRVVNPQISAGLESGILKALEKVPSQRFQSAAELQAVLETVALSGPSELPREKASSGISPNTAPADISGTPPFGLKVFGLAAIAAILFAGLLIGLNVKGWRDRLLHPAQPSGDAADVPMIKSRPSIAVLGFKNVSGRPEEAWISTALSEMLTTELAVGEQLRTVPGENVARMKIDLSLPDADTYGKDTLAKIRKNLGTDEVVLGSYVPLEKGQIRVDLRLQSTADGETLVAVSKKATEEQLDELVSSAGLELREKLGAGEVSSVEAATVRASLPSNPEAAKFYAEGLAKMRVFDYLAARDLLQKAVAAEPTHALAHANLAAAWASMGYDVKAAAEAKRAFDLSSNLSRQDRLLVEGHYRETTREWDKAVQIYKTLFGFFPDNLEYGILLAQAEIRGGNATEAFTTVDSLRKLPAPQNDDPRIDLVEANAAQSVADFTHQLTAASQAVKKGRATGARLLVARALVYQSIALRKLGKPKESLGLLEDAQQIYSASGDKSGVAATLNSNANTLADLGDVQGAKTQYEGALAIYREIGNTVGAAKTLDNIGSVISDAGDVEGGKRLSAEALALLQDTGDKHDIANTSNNLATYYTLQGDLSGATKLFRQSLKLRQEIGDKSGEAGSLSNLGELLAEQGDVAGAKEAFGESLRIHQEIGEKEATVYQLDGLGKVLMDSGDLAGANQRFEQTQAVARETDAKPLLPAALGGMGQVLVQQGKPNDARKAYEQALTIDKEIGYSQESAEIGLAVAELDFEEGRAVEAEVLIQDAVKVFRAAKLSVDEITAHTILARGLLAAGKPNDAQKELESARSLATKTQNRLVALDFAITEARVLAALGRTAEARAVLTPALADARTRGLVRYELEARLAAAEIELKSGSTDDAVKNLTALEKDAAAEGYLLIAQKAGAKAKVHAP